MAYKLSSKTKTHIADVATRAKFAEKYKASKAAMAESAYQQLYKLYQNELFVGLNPVVLNACSKSSAVELNSDDIDVSDIKAVLDFKFDKIEIFSMPASIYGVRYRLSFSEVEDKEKFREFLDVIAEIKAFRSALMAAMAPFRSGEKMIKALPWTDEYYPQEDKTPTCHCEIKRRHGSRRLACQR